MTFASKVQKTARQTKRPWQKPDSRLARGFVCLAGGAIFGIGRGVFCIVYVSKTARATSK